MLSALGLALLRHRSGQRPRGALPPLFIIGSGRSGNTLVRRVLMAGGEIHIPPETFVLGDIIEGWPRTALLTWREKVWLFCAHFEKHPHFGDFGLTNLDDFATEAIGLAQRDLRSLIESFYGHLARAQGSGARRWGDKTPYNTFRLPALCAAFPDAQFLWLVRDGRDAALSYVESGLFGTLAEAGRRWTTANAACAELSRGRADVLRVHYEALVQDSETEFARICDWAALSFTSEMLTDPAGPLGDVEAHAHHDNVRRPISATSVGRWQTGMTQEDLAAFPESFWDMMRRTGYRDRDRDIRRTG